MKTRNNKYILYLVLGVIVLGIAYTGMQRYYSRTAADRK